MNGKPCCLTLDTRAEKTLVQPGLFNVKQLPDAPQRLCGVMGHYMSLKGPVEVCVGIGSVEVWLLVYTADLDEEWTVCKTN